MYKINKNIAEKTMSKQWENNERSPVEGAYTQSCFTYMYTVWTFFCSHVIKKIKFFKPLLFSPKIVFGVDFVSVFPLNILLHFETDNNIPKRLLFEKIKNILFVKTSFKFLHCVDIFCSQVHTSYVTQKHTFLCNIQCKTRPWVCEFV